MKLQANYHDPARKERKGVKRAMVEKTRGRKIRNVLQGILGVPLSREEEDSLGMKG